MPHPPERNMSMSWRLAQAGRSGISVINNDSLHSPRGNKKVRRDMLAAGPGCLIEGATATPVAIMNAMEEISVRWHTFKVALYIPPDSGSGRLRTLALRLPNSAARSKRLRFFPHDIAVLRSCRSEKLDQR